MSNKSAESNRPSENDKRRIRDLWKRNGRPGLPDRRFLAETVFHIEPNYSEWGRMDSWTIQEATALLAGIDPEYLTWGDFDKIEEEANLEKAIQYKLVKRYLARRWKGNRELTKSPLYFMAWAAEVDLQAPQELIECLPLGGEDVPSAEDGEESKPIPINESAKERNNRYRLIAVMLSLLTDKSRRFSSEAELIGWITENNKKESGLSKRQLEKVFSEVKQLRPNE